MSVLRFGPATLEVATGPATLVYILFGEPVAHSWSPRLQGAAFAAVGQDAVYVACAVPPSGLAAAFDDLRRHAADGRIGGANITVPHKRAVFDLVDHCDAVAEWCGAVNTICIEGTGSASVQLHGLNTDVLGLTEALRVSGATLAAQRVMVLGTGGMARAAVVAAFQEGAATVRVVSRSLPRAQELLDAVAERFRGRLPQLACAGWDDVESLLADADVLVHATPLGLHATDASPCRFDQATSALFVQDSVYGEQATPLVRAARARGLRACDGRLPLVYQAAAAFTAWTGRVAPVDIMRRSAGAADD